jgi:hypothetical protein
VESPQIIVSKKWKCRRSITVFFLALSACAPQRAGGEPPSQMPLDQLVARPPQSAARIERVATWGILFPMAPNSVFLMAPGESLHDGAGVPEPTQCLQLLISKAQFPRLRSLAGKAVLVEGDMYFAKRSEDSVLINVRIQGRYAHLYCQYDQENIPILLLTRWQAKPA